MATEATIEIGRSGTKELEYWARCEKARLDPNVDHAGLYVPSGGSEDASLCKVKRPPHSLPKGQLRYLDVEAAFVSLAVTGAEGLYGKRSDLDAEGEKLFDACVDVGKESLRDLCYHIYVMRRRWDQFKAEPTYSGMAIFGVTRDGFSEWLRHRTIAVKSEIEGQN